MERPICAAELEEVVARPRLSFWIAGRWVHALAYTRSGHLWTRDVVSGALAVQPATPIQVVAGGQRPRVRVDTFGAPVRVSLEGMQFWAAWDAERRVASVPVPFFAAGELAELFAPPTFVGRRVTLEHAATWVRERVAHIVLTVRVLSASDAPTGAVGPEVDVRDAITDSEPLRSERHGHVQLAAYDREPTAKLLLRRQDGRVVLVVGRARQGERSAIGIALRRAALRRLVRPMPSAPGNARLYFGHPSRRLVASVIHATRDTVWLQASLAAFSPGRIVQLMSRPGATPTPARLLIRSLALVPGTDLSPVLRLHLAGDE